MKKMIIEKFVANDGTEFESAVECAEHEAKLEKMTKHTTYHCLRFKPDLTEGRGYYGVWLIELYNTTGVDDEALLRDFVTRTFGREVAFVMGVSPVTGWNIFKIEDRETWLASEPETFVGDYAYRGRRVRLIMGKDDEGLVVDETVYDDLGQPIVNRRR